MRCGESGHTQHTKAGPYSNYLKQSTVAVRQTVVTAAVTRYRVAQMCAHKKCHGGDSLIVMPKVGSTRVSIAREIFLRPPSPLNFCALLRTRSLLLAQQPLERPTGSRW